MKTTVDLNDELLRQAKEVARARGMTLRTLLESALRHELDATTKADAFVLRDASVDGRGMTPTAATGGWAPLRDTIYEGRGA
jgi:predicted transcriptional regulator